MNSELIKLLSLLMSIDGEIEIFVRKMLAESSTYDIIEFLTSNKLVEFVQSLGIRDIAESYYNLLSDLTDSGTADLKAQVKNLNEDAIKGAVTMLINTDVRTFNDNVSSNIQVVSKTLAESVLNGDSFELSVQKMKDAGMTSSNRIETILHTGYYNVSRITTKLAFKGRPEQRFKYFGGVLPTSSDECKWLMQNQKEEGYTVAEIDAGIETPFHYTYGALKGQVKKIFWSGRHPNFNCIHTWMPNG